ncbi:MAG: hypothetical protein ACK4E3_10550 [Brevundimonas sp.]|uniref:hypothetical protein n=1 Tax=Brevundimonas sp. TaxID=1871086 RepID=UPI003919A3B3
MGGAVRDAGMQLAIEKCGGVRALARRLGERHQKPARWRRVPRAWVFRVADAAGVMPEDLRPDLESWIALQRAARRAELVRQRFALAPGEAARVTVRRAEVTAEAMDIVDFGLILKVAEFAARQHGLPVRAVLAEPARGRGINASPAQKARSHAAALCVVVARVAASRIAAVLGVSRQAVESAAESYLRQRDGDHPEDIEDGRVAISRTRRRAAVTARAGLWEQEVLLRRELDGGAP